MTYLLGTFGSFCEPLGASGSFWEPLGAFGSFWEPLGASGNLWDPLGASGSLWEPLGASGSLLEPLGALERLGETWSDLKRLGETWSRIGPLKKPLQSLQKTICTRFRAARSVSPPPSPFPSCPGWRTPPEGPTYFEPNKNLGFSSPKASDPVFGVFSRKRLRKQGRWPLGRKTSKEKRKGRRKDMDWRL